MSVIHKNGDWTMQEQGGYDNVEKVVAVHIARRELQSANRSGNANRLPRAGAQLESDPVLRLRIPASRDLNAGQVRQPVTIKIRNGEWRADHGHPALRISSRFAGVHDLNARGQNEAGQPDKC